MIINWFGSIGQGQGYSGSGEHICVALEKLGFDVRLVGFKQANDTNLTPAGLKIKHKPFIKSDIAICYGFPVSFNSMDAWKYRFGFTMFETDKLPVGEAWAGKHGDTVRSCSNLTRLWVPCEHNRRLFYDNGVRVPIDVIPLGINADLYPLLKRSTQRDIFTFLQLGTLSVRKNPGDVISAFLTLFKKNPKAKLILKTQGGHLKNFKFIETDNIEIIDRYSTKEEVIELYRQADCFVFPSHGEGFGLPPLEAMATGLPVIVANNTGMMDFADPKYCYPVKSEGVSPAMLYPPEWGDVGNWYNIDRDDLKAKMRHVFENQAEARAKGKLASEWVKKNWTFDNTAKSIAIAIKGVIQ